MEIIGLGFLGGCLFATVFIGLLITSDKGQHDGNRDSDSCVPFRSRDGCGNNGHHQQVGKEEMIIVLNTIRSSGSSYEKMVIDKIIDMIGDADEVIREEIHQNSGD